MILFVKNFLTQLACGFIYCAYFKSQSSSLVWCPTRFLPTVTWHQSCINKYIPYIQRKKHRYCISFFANETRKWLDSFNFLLCSFIKQTMASSTELICMSAIRRSLGKNLKFEMEPFSENISWSSSSLTDSGILERWRVRIGWKIFWKFFDPGFLNLCKGEFE